MIIGISGKARSGKDQFAEYLQEIFDKRHHRYFAKMAFADELKMMCLAAFGLEHDQLWGDRKEEMTAFGKNESGNYGVSSNPSDYWTPREIMQAIGSFYRSIDYDFWVKQVDKSIKKMPHRSDFLITDVRHINECEYIKQNGVLVRVTRPSADRIHGMEHESETALDDREQGYFDVEIANEGTLDDLYLAADNAADAILLLEKMRKQGRSYDGEEG